MKLFKKKTDTHYKLNIPSISYLDGRREAFEKLIDIHNKNKMAVKYKAFPLHLVQDKNLQKKIAEFERLRASYQIQKDDYHQHWDRAYQDLWLEAAFSSGYLEASKDLNLNKLNEAKDYLIKAIDEAEGSLSTVLEKYAVK